MSVRRRHPSVHKLCIMLARSGCFMRTNSGSQPTFCAICACNIVLIVFFLILQLCLC